MVQEEDSEDGVKNGFRRQIFEQLDIENRVLNAALGGGSASLDDAGVGDVDAGQVADLRGEEEFGVAESAADREDARLGSEGAGAHNPGDEVAAEGHDGGPREVGGSVSGIEVVVIADFAF